jgi:hypothetical protein
VKVTIALQAGGSFQMVNRFSARRKAFYGWE